jgi:hypothetical protein
VLGASVSLDRVETREIGWAMGYEAVCRDVTLTGGDPVPVPAATATLPDEYYESYAMELFTVVEVVAALP